MRAGWRASTCHSAWCCHRHSRHHLCTLALPAMRAPAAAAPAATGHHQAHGRCDGADGQQHRPGGAGRARQARRRTAWAVAARNPGRPAVSTCWLVAWLAAWACMHLCSHTCTHSTAQRRHACQHPALLHATNACTPVATATSSAGRPLRASCLMPRRRSSACCRCQRLRRSTASSAPPSTACWRCCASRWPTCRTATRPRLCAPRSASWRGSCRARRRTWRPSSTASSTACPAHSWRRRSRASSAR